MKSIYLIMQCLAYEGNGTLNNTLLNKGYLVEPIACGQLSFPELFLIELKLSKRGSGNYVLYWDYMIT